MIESLSLSWILVLVLAATGLWFFFCGVRPGSGHAASGPTDRITYLAHAVMAAVMAAMLWRMG
jgi:hypothetical protein